MNPFFYLIGFRFNIFVIAVLIIFLIERKSLGNFLKEELFNKDFSKFYCLIFAVLMPLVLTLTTGFVSNIIESNDPEYFYELGLSSIVDYPVYLIWNFPQFIFLILIIKYFFKRNLISVLFSVIVLVLLFGIEAYDFKKNEININIIITLSSVSIIYSIISLYLKNIYYASFSLITIIWVYVLAFGSKNRSVVNIFLAKHFEIWEGHFAVSKSYSDYSLPFYFILSVISFLIFLLFAKKKK